MLHDSANVLRKGSSGSSVIEKVYLIHKKAKGIACRYLKTMEKGINLALHAWIVIERVAVKVTELRDVPLHGGALWGYGNVGLDKSSFLERYKALKTLTMFL